jgi:hypothetical protein
MPWPKPPVRVRAGARMFAVTAPASHGHCAGSTARCPEVVTLVARGPPGEAPVRRHRVMLRQCFLLRARAAPADNRSARWPG